MSVVHKFQGTDACFDWENTVEQAYDHPAAKGATRKVMIGDDEGAEYFAFRYFHIQPGGHSTLNDYHAHDHGMMILHGRARLTLGTETYELSPRDIVYVQPWEYHHLEALGNEPMGFLCVIPNKSMITRLRWVDRLKKLLPRPVVKTIARFFYHRRPE